MTEKSRTEYSKKNTEVAVLSRIAAILMGFAVRVVFTHTLSENYVGINGLFTDILNVLALSELGAGTAITYALYGPIAQGDVEKQKSLMRLYRQFYRIVAAIVLFAGLLVIPFMDVLIKNRPDVDHLVLIYLMYLANSVLSYLLIYKRTLIEAHQLSYVGTLCQTVFLLLQDVAQILILLTTGNFILFLGVYLVCTLGNNLAISAKADRMYPFLRERRALPLAAGERQEIFKNIRAMLMHKIGTVVVNNTDNLLLSAIVGITSVGLYSNYYLLIGSVRQVLDQIFQGITASVGNLGATEDSGRVKKIFETSFFVGQWMYGFAAICLYELLNPFVAISFGENYVFPRTVVLILCINFFVTGMRKATLVFRDSLGLFWYDRYKSIAEALINLAVSVLLAQRFGTAGVFWGTFISTVATSMWVEPYVLYRHKLHAPLRGYLAKYGVYSLVVAALWLVTDIACTAVEGSLPVVLLVRFLICALLPNLCMLLLYARTLEFRFLRKKALGQSENGGSEGFRAEEEALLQLLCAALHPGEKSGQKAHASEADGRKLLALADHHGVAGLLYGELAEGELLPQKCREDYERRCQQTVLQSYHLLFLGRAIVERLAKSGISVLVLKGVGVSGLYPVPELRKSGDIDLLLLDPGQLKEASAVLEAEGFSAADGPQVNHHVVFHSPEKIEIELHTLLAEPFDARCVNRQMRQMMQPGRVRMVWEEVMGVPVPHLADAEQAYALLLHMLQHYLRAGFGLRMLCDWAVFWNRDHGREVEETYLALIRESGLCGFSEMITALSVRRLGLSRERAAFLFAGGPEAMPPEADTDELLREILESGEFGREGKDRMVTLRGTGITAYVREFHHQMRLNYPKAGGIFLCWPLLWILTLLRFLRNNKKIRHISARALLKKAGQRSRLTEKMRLFTS